MANCVKCGQPLREGAKFCGACGAKVEEQRFCTQCGAQLLPGDAFCTQCGAKIGLQESWAAYFDVEDCVGGVRITKYNGPKMGVIIIPDKIKGSPVTEIDDLIFMECSLFSIQAPKGSVAERYAKSNGHVFQPL